MLKLIEMVCLLTVRIGDVTQNGAIFTVTYTEIPVKYVSQTYM